MSRGVALLGSTGSIGKSALTVVRRHPGRLRVVALAAYGHDPELLEAQAREHRPDLLAVVDPQAGRALAARLPPGVRLEVGAAALESVATHPAADVVLSALVGAAGLRPTAAAVGAGKLVALANKESLVVAGRLLLRLAAERGATVVPVDSEHVALDQALRGGARGEVSRLVLTASGGPFLERPLQTWDAIRPEEALRHPTWSMGRKISVDSATLMNKGLELIEASYLFGVPSERVSVVVHPQSIVHSLVEFCDGSWLAQLAPNDMVFPIQYALSYPERWETPFARLAVEELGELRFQPLDPARFPAVGLARAALAAGESAPAVLNAANEVAVEAFLGREIPFTALLPVVEETLAAHTPCPLADLDAALVWDEWGRARARQALAGRRLRA